MLQNEIINLLLNKPMSTFCLESKLLRRVCRRREENRLGVRQTHMENSISFRRCSLDMLCNFFLVSIGGGDIFAIRFMWLSLSYLFLFVRMTLIYKNCVLFMTWILPQNSDRLFAPIYYVHKSSIFCINENKLIILNKYVCLLININILIIILLMETIFSIFLSQ